MRKTLLVLSVAAGLALAGFVLQQAIGRDFGPVAVFGTALLAVAFFALVALYVLSGTRHRALVGNILLAGAVTVVSYVVLDLVAGAVLIEPLSPPLVPDPFLHHALVPNSTPEFRHRDFAYVQRVNNLGMRGEDVAVEKAPRTKRVLMLGDSFTMGRGVEDDETFSALVGPLVQPDVSACSDLTIEVLNGGVDSYAPILSLIQLRRNLSRLAPDLVVLNLDNSDLIQEAAYRLQAERDANGEIVAVPMVEQASTYDRARSWVERNLFFTRLLPVYINRAFNRNELTIRSVVNEGARELVAHTLEGDVDRTQQWNDIFESVARIAALADSLGSDFVLTTYPWAHQLGDTDWVPGRYEFMEDGEPTTDLSARTVRAHASELSLDLFEMYPYFRAYDGDDPLYFDHDMHWTAAGQRVAANALADHLRAHHVPGWCAES